MNEESNTHSIAERIPVTQELDDEVDFSPFFDYLQSAQGHEIASRVLSLVEDIKKAALDKNFSHARFNRGLEAGVLVVAIVVIAGLSIIGKLNSTVGILLGSVVGYFFGRNK